MNTPQMFRFCRGKLGDTYVPYRNSDQDLTDGLSACIEELWFSRKDLFLDDQMKTINDFKTPEVRVDSHLYSAGDIIYVNDPIELYICTIGGTSDASPVSYDGETVTDGTSLFARYSFEEAFNKLALGNYIIYYCLMLDADEKANEALAMNHYQMFVNGI